MNKQIYEAAKKVNHMAYSRYSHYNVSAAVELKNGKILTGFNIENSSYPLSICAERCALFRTYAEGYTREDIVSILIYTNRTDSYPYPCGACRQVMSELMFLDSPVYIANDTETIEEYTVRELLPKSFGPENLK